MSDTHAHRPVAPAGGMADTVRRKGPVDPVLALLHRHYELCAGAVDPLEIAAGLEAHGITDRVAARFRHRDVFALAEELFARVPRESPAAPGAPAPDGSRPTVRRALAHLLPGVVCAAGVAASHLSRTALAPLAGGATPVAVGLTACAVVRRGPLSVPGLRGPALWTGWLVAFALYGPGALGALLGSSHRTYGLPAPAAAAGLLALAFAPLPAAWCVSRFGRRARARLAGARTLREFTAAVRLSTAGTFALFTLVLLALLALLTPACLLLDRGARPDLVTCGGFVALGLLLFTGRLLAVHGFRAAAAASTGAACAAEAAALALAGCPPTAGAARAFVAAAGPGAVQAAACAAAALALACHACVVLARSRAHGAPARPDAQPYDPAYAAALYGSPHAPDITSAYVPCHTCGVGAAPRTDAAAR